MLPKDQRRVIWYGISERAELRALNYVEDHDWKIVGRPAMQVIEKESETAPAGYSSLLETALRCGLACMFVCGAGAGALQL